MKYENWLYGGSHGGVKLVIGVEQVGASRLIFEIRFGTFHILITLPQSRAQ